MENHTTEVFLKTNIMKTIVQLITVLSVLASQPMKAQNIFGEIRGQVKDSAAKMPIPYANVIVLVDDRIITGATTDDDGYFSIKPVKPGNVQIKLDVIGYNPRIINQVVVNTGKMTYIDMLTSPVVFGVPIVEVYEYQNPLIDKGQISTMQVLEEEQIRASPYMDIKQLAATTAGVYQEEGEGGSIYMRGARENGTAYFIDGVRVVGDFRLPKNAVKEMKVLTGGIPASIGDATGGVILITTKGFSTY